MWKGMTQVYDILNKEWKSTCRILFGKELGELKEYEPWLLEHVIALRREHSQVSGKDVYLGLGAYCKGAKFIGFDEIDFNKRFEPLGINEIKDIDSITEAVQERVCYAGGIVLGNSQFVEKSTDISDSHYIYDSILLGNSKYIAHSSVGRLCEYCFGCNGIGDTKFCINGYETYKDVRCFEIWDSEFCSDAYYVFGCNGCQEAIFSFNLSGKRHVIGNLELDRQKYLSLKKKIIEELRGELEKRKRVKSIMEMVNQTTPPQEEIERLRKKLEKRAWRAQEGHLEPMEQAFSHTSALILGKSLSGVDKYDKWLLRHIWQQKISSSVLTGRKILLADYSNHFAIPDYRLIKRDELEEIKGELILSEEEVEQVGVKNAAELLNRIMLDAPEYDIENINVIDCSFADHSANGYRTIPMVHSKNCAFTSWARHSDNIFGSSTMWDCSSCIKCYNSVRLSRCLEVDNSKNCSDGYFLHNCENVHDSMFCFNAKNLKYAIGNAPMPTEKYNSAKASLLSQIVSELEKTKTLKWDIYNIGCARA